MRKQTKVVAVASAAALLAIGASMTSFAATGWVEEDGTWYYYDKDGNRVENEWKKSGDNWYWLDSDEGGSMAIEKLIEDDGDTFYVDSTGAMVKNTWVKVVNEDQDDDTDPAEYRYYYMQNTGKAYKAGDNSNNVRFRTIDGKRYAFDADGKMLYGWVSEDGELAVDDSEWEDAQYYLGSWEDGAMKTGWQKITVYDDKDGKDDDYDYWFNFKSNGEKRNPGADKEWKSNGKTYKFDDRGVMVYEWYTATPSTTATTGDWKYFNSPEDGARVTKGWFRVVAPASDNENTFAENIDTEESFATKHAEDESEKWYYADNKGNLKVGVIESIKGKYYGFYPEGSKAGAMLKGLCILETNGDKIVRVIEEDIDSDDLDDVLKHEFQNDTFNQASDWNDDVHLYYFSDDELSDGSMKTGNVTVNLDGSSYTFLFQKTGNAKSGKGVGMTGVDDKKYIYKEGCRIKADSDDKFQLVFILKAAGSDNCKTEGVEVLKLDAPTMTQSYTNKDGDSVNYEILYGAGVADANNLKDTSDPYIIRLVNTSGNIQKSKTASKDGDDCYYYVNKNYIPCLYTDNKTLKTENGVTPSISSWEDIVSKQP